ncbi:hypothetical protein [Hymenobacter sp. BT730]|uniref:hypothetical protein n=1 Tax=Hymenobacter sp. BT730 TaxID=3063332 RepID=UPI0026DFFC76|nr:hypothetical protein [Hymenobacter sp. BT730]
MAFSWLLLSGLLLSSCEHTDCGCVAPPGFSDSQLLHTWRLDEISQAGKVLSSGTAIKDQYTLTFKTKGSYTQTILASGNELSGTWQLTSNGHALELTDHKGDIQAYAIEGSWPHGGSIPEQISLYRENKDKLVETLVFSLVP